VHSTFFKFSETGNQLKFSKYSGPVHRAQTAIAQLCRDTPDFSYSDQTCDFITFQTLVYINYSILSVLYEVGLLYVRDVDGLRRHLNGGWSSIQQMVIDQMIDQ